MHGVLSSQKVPDSSGKVPVKIPSPGLGNPCVVHSNLRISLFCPRKKIKKLMKGFYASLQQEHYNIFFFNFAPNCFFNTSSANQTAQKQKSRTTKSPLMQDWVFRLGGKYFIGEIQKVCKVIRLNQVKELRKVPMSTSSTRSIQENSTQSDFVLEGSNELLVLMEFQINVYLLDF